VFPHLLLGGQNLDELAEFTFQKRPAPMYVLDQGMSLVLGQNKYLADTRIDTVGKWKIDDPELAAKWRGGLGPDLGQISEA
jgi:hypothetical protein